MDYWDTVRAQERANDKRRREAEAAASIYPNDKLRVRPTRYQAIATNSGQIVQFRPTEIIDDPHRIRIMDEHDVEYVVVSRERKPRKAPAGAEQVTALVEAVDDAIQTTREVAGVKSAEDCAEPEWAPKEGE